MANVGNVNVRIRADISDLQRNLRSMQTQLNSVASTTQVQTRSISNSFSNMANMIKSSIAGVIVYQGLNVLTNGLSNTVKAFNDFESGLLGLESILEAQGKSFSTAKGFIDEYINDGLVPLGDAVTAYKTLAARGYSDEQIKNTLTRLKDAAAFGRQAGLSIGDAVRGAAEGLKNENSMLVDNAGITKNVAKMWDEYAKSIGTNAQALTQQQKIQAEVNGIMKESQFQVGNASLYSQTLGGKLSSLSAQFSVLSASIGAIFAPVLQAVLPYVTEAIVKFTTLANTLAAFSRSIFGSSAIQKSNLATQKAAVKSSIDLGKSQGKVAEGVKKVSKALASNVQGFDELNQIKKESADAGAGTGSGSVGDIGGAGMDIPAVDTGGIVVPELDFSGYQKSLETIKSIFKPLFDMDFTPLKTAFAPLADINWAPMVSGLKSFVKGFATLFESISNNVLAPFVEFVLVPLAQKLMEGVIPAGLKLIGEAFGFIGLIIEPLKPIIEAIFWVLGGIAGLAFDGLTLALQGIAFILEKINNFAREHDLAWKAIVLTLATVTIAAGLIAGAIAAVIIGMELFAAASAIATVAGMAFASIMAVVTSPITLTISAIVALIAVIMLLVEYWPQISQAASDAWDWTVEVFKVAGTWFYDKVITPISKYFTGLWVSISDSAKKGWNKLVEFLTPIATWFYDKIIKPVVDFFSKMWESIKTTTSIAITKVMEIIEPIVELIRAVWDRISTAISQIWEIIKAIILTIVAFVDIFVMEPLAEVFKKAWEGISETVSTVWNGIKTYFTTVLEWIKTNITTPLTTTFNTLWNGVKTSASTAWNNIKTNLTTVYNWIKTNIVTPLETAFSTLWEGIKTTAGTAWESIKNGLKSMINIMIGLLESFINSFVSMFNFLIRSLNKVSFTAPDWVPDIGGKTFGVSLSEVSPIKIPRLAEGGIVDRSTLAMIGEGDSSEAVIPLNERGLEPLINGIVNAMSQVLSDLGTGGSNQQPVNVNLTLDGETLSKATYKYNQVEQNRRSSRLVTVI